jgi:hypothetical protein
VNKAKAIKVLTFTAGVVAVMVIFNYASSAYAKSKTKKPATTAPATTATATS